MRLLSGLFKTATTLAAFAIFAGAVMRILFVDVYTVPHNGMAPTLVYGDQVLVWRRASPDLGNVMICEHPSRAGAQVVGRAIAFAGALVGTDPRSGVVMVGEDAVNLEPVGPMRFYDVTRNRLFYMDVMTEAYRKQRRHQIFLEQGATFGLRTYQVNRGVYLLGDNRSPHGDDSREFGEVDPDKCNGQVFMRWKPAPPNDDDIDNFYLDIID